MRIERLIENTLTIQAIPAPPFGEEARASHMHKLFASAGLERLEIDELGNVLGCVPGGDGPPVVVCAHLDSIFPREEHQPASRRGDRLIGPGVGDNAIALAALIELAGDLAPRKHAGDIWLIADVGEEGIGGLRGMRHIVNRFSDRIRAYLALEGMALGVIYTRALPVRRFRVSIKTSGGHSWIHAGRPSAVHALLELGAQLSSIKLPARPRSSLNIGRIHGGTSVNAIASAAEMEIDLRSEQPAALERIERSLFKAIRGAARKDITIEMNRIDDRPGGSLPDHHPLVRLAEECYRSAGLRELHKAIGSTDASIPLSMGYPAVGVGLAFGGNAHTQEEFVELIALPAGFAALKSLIEGCTAL